MANAETQAALTHCCDIYYKTLFLTASHLKISHKNTHRVRKFKSHEHQKNTQKMVYNYFNVITTHFFSTAGNIDVTWKTSLTAEKYQYKTTNHRCTPLHSLQNKNLIRPHNYIQSNNIWSFYFLHILKMHNFMNKQLENMSKTSCHIWNENVLPYAKNKQWQSHQQNKH